MQKTYENFKHMAQLYKGEKDLTNLVDTYRKTKDPAIIAYIFTEQYGYLKTQANKYFYLTDEDKASFILEEISKALLNYDSKKGAKIQTLISTYVNNRLRTETQQLQHHKRCANNSTDSYEDVIATNETVAESVEYSTLELLIYLKQQGLSENELKYCEVVIAEPHDLKDTEVAKKIGITSMAVKYMKDRLKNKLDLTTLTA